MNILPRRVRITKATPEEQEQLKKKQLYEEKLAVKAELLEKEFQKTEQQIKLETHASQATEIKVLFHVADVYLSLTLHSCKIYTMNYTT